jgi:hypothetical protein
MPACNFDSQATVPIKVNVDNDCFIPCSRRSLVHV